MKTINQFVFLLFLTIGALCASETPSSVIWNPSRQSYLGLLPPELRLDLVKKVDASFLADAYFWAIRKQQIAWNKAKKQAQDIEQRFSLPGISLSGQPFVYSVAFNSNASLLASGSADTTIRIWDANSGAAIKTLRGPSGHTYTVLCVAFDPQTSLLASGSADHTIKLWDIDSGTVIRTLTDLASVRSIAFNPSGTLLASISGNTIKIWGIQSGQVIKTIPLEQQVMSVAFNPQGTLLASGTSDSTIKIWGMQSYQAIKIFKLPATYIRQVTFNPYGTQLAAGLSDGSIKIYDLHSGQAIKTLRTQDTWSIDSVAFHPSGNLLATGNEVNDAIRIWDISSETVIATLTGHTDTINSVTFNKSGNALASGSDIARIWNLYNPQDMDFILNAQLTSSKTNLFHIARQKFHTGQPLDLDSPKLWEAFKSLPPDWQETIKKTAILDEDIVSRIELELKALQACPAREPL